MLSKLSRFIGLLLVIIVIGVVIRLAPVSNGKTLLADVEYGSVSSAYNDQTESLHVGLTRLFPGSQVTTATGESWVAQGDQYAISLAPNSQVTSAAADTPTLIHDYGKAWFRLLHNAPGQTVIVSGITITPTSDQLTMLVETPEPSNDTSVAALVTIVQGAATIGPDQTEVASSHIARLVRHDQQQQVIVTSLDAVRENDAWFAKNKVLDEEKPWEKTTTANQPSILNWLPTSVTDRLKSLLNWE